MSHKFVTPVSPTDAITVLQAMRRAADVELAAGRRVVGIEVDEATHELFLVAFRFYRHSGISGRSVLNLPVTVGREPGWRIVTRE